MLINYISGNLADGNDNCRTLHLVYFIFHNLPDPNPGGLRPVFIQEADVKLLI